MNVTEVRDSDLKNAFSRNFQFHRRDPNSGIFRTYSLYATDLLRNRKIERDNFLTANEAVDFGIIDQVPEMTVPKPRIQEEE